jgi:hypothetical protein
MAIKRYFLESTVWHNDAQKGLSYLGAYQDTGGRPRIVEQLAAELQDSFGFGKLNQVWAYRNIFGTEAVGIHADFSQINVNIWITPEKYCKNDRGGLMIYQKRAPSDWPFERYNGDASSIAEYLDGALCDRISYRENRAIIFDSSLFHGSDCCDFEDCYEGLRTNLTLLFGTRA